MNSILDQYSGSTWPLGPRSCFIASVSHLIVCFYRRYRPNRTKLSPNSIEMNAADTRYQAPIHQNSAEELPLAVNKVANDGSPLTEMNTLQNSPTNDAS